jgi:hypothetical protein
MRGYLHCTVCLVEELLFCLLKSIVFGRTVGHSKSSLCIREVTLRYEYIRIYNNSCHASGQIIKFDVSLRKRFA